MWVVTTSAPLSTARAPMARRVTIRTRAATAPDSRARLAGSPAWEVPSGEGSSLGARAPVNVSRLLKDGSLNDFAFYDSASGARSLRMPRLTPYIPNRRGSLPLARLYGYRPRNRPRGRHSTHRCRAGGNQVPLAATPRP